MTVANVEMAAAWDGAEGQHWAAHAERYEAASILHWEALVHSIDIATNDVVLDIGRGEVYAGSGPHGCVGLGPRRLVVGDHRPPAACSTASQARRVAVA